GKVAESERALDRVKKQAKSKSVQAESDRFAKKSIFDQETVKYDDIKEEIKKCTVVSPQDGMVVYYVPEQSRYGSGTQQSIGGKDKDNQIVYPGQPARVRVDAFPDHVLKAHVKQVATVASQADWMSSDVKVYQTMVAIDEPVENLKPGMSAEVTILASDTKED